MASPRKGTIVDDRYELERKIGSGGMADVWLADDQELDRQVAIKILHERFAQDQEFVERFRREAQSAAGLQHPNVVSIFDRGEFRDTYFIAMEYVDGPSLKELVRGGMGPNDAIDFTRQILKAASFAHRKGIVHRDLKPQNVLIDDEGRARVTDFGIARADEASDITATGSVMGTAHYLSPEQAQGRETTPASDIYSIGVILYEALTGRVPFEGDSAVAVALKQVSETPKRPSALNPKVPPALDAVAMRALAKDPSARFADADAFIKALDAAERAPDRPRPEDTAVFGAVSPQGEHPDEDEELDEGRDERRRWWRWALIALLVAGVAALVAFALTRPDRVEVPNVTGEEVGTATELLEGRGFDVDLETVPSTAVQDQVLEQDPVAGETVDEGSTVTLTVSSGPEIVRVPEVEGLTQPDAVTRLQRAGLEVEPQLRFSNSIPRGIAIGTEPGAGNRIAAGSTVQLLVSKGSNLATVPDVVGLQVDSALAELEATQLSANVVQRDDDAPEGEVVSQSPAPGQQLRRGMQVTLFVSTGAIQVPDVIGAARKPAVNTLKQAGFSVAVRTEDTESAAEDGVVIDQFPPGGSRGRRGDTVTIVVGRFLEPLSR